MKDKGVIAPIVYSRTLMFVALYALLVGLYSVLPALKEYSEDYNHLADTPAEIHAALTLVLGWLLVFRTNTAYARWWEARTLWGALVNASRNTAIKMSSLGKVPEEELQLTRKSIIGFAPLLRDHLRGEVDGQCVQLLTGMQQVCVHPPSEYVRLMYSLLERWRAAGWINDMDLRVIDEDLKRFLDICGGCERIRNTRIARSYKVFARQCVFLYLATFPWGIVNDFLWWTIPLTIIVSYFMIGLETVAEHVEEPFGYDEDDLNLDALCDTIEGSVNEIFDRRGELPSNMTN